MRKKLSTLIVSLAITLGLIFPSFAHASQSIDYKWGYLLGSNDWDFAYVYTDSDGSPYLVGSFSGTMDFDPTGVTENHTSNGDLDMFLSKYTADGTYQWTKTWGGTGQDTAYQVFWDASHNMYVFGDYASASVDFDPSAGTDTKAGVAGDVFVTKYNSDGSYAWTKTWGGTGADRGTSVTMDASGNFYFTGAFRTTVDFNVDPVGVDSKTSVGNYDSYLLKYNSDWSYGWVRTWGGTSYDYAERVKVAPSGDIYVIGDFSNTPNFNTSGGTDNHTSLGQYDCYLVKYSSAGAYGWSKVWGSAGDDMCTGMVIDTNNNLYIGGYSDNYSSATSIDLDPSGTTDLRTSYGNGDAILSKFDSSGNYIWGKHFGSTDFDMVTTLAIDSSNYLYILGDFAMTVDLDTGASQNLVTAQGGGDVFMTKYDLDGNYIWSKIFGGSGGDYISYKGAELTNDVLYVSINAGGNINLNPDSSTQTTNAFGSMDFSLSRLNIDNSAPTNNSVTINGQSDYTNSSNLSLTLASTEAYQMMISDSSDFAGASWESFVPTKTFRTTSADGSKTIYAKFRDTLDNISTTVTDSITLDTTPPYVFSSLGGPNEYLTTLLPTFEFEPTLSEHAGISKYQILVDGSVYIDNIDPLIPSDKNWRESDDKYIVYSQNKITVTAKQSSQKIETGKAYKWAVRAIDQAGNSVTTTQKIIRLNTNQSNFSNNPHSLTLLGIGKKALNISALNNDVVPGLRLPTGNLSFYGISEVSNTVNLRVERMNAQNSGLELVFNTSTIVGNDSRFGINTPQALSPGTYYVSLSSTNFFGDYLEFKEFKLEIGFQSIFITPKLAIAKDRAMTQVQRLIEQPKSEVVTPEPAQEQSSPKRCFLWWCW